MKSEFQIEHLTSLDSDSVAALAASVSYNNIQDHSQGFLFNPLSPVQYQSRLRHSRYSFKASADGLLCGYCLNYTGEEIAALIEKGEMSNKPEILEAVSELGLNASFLFVDQIVIVDGHRKAGLGKSLLEKSISILPQRYSLAICDIGHAPIRNHASVSFFIKNEWKLYKEVQNLGKKYGIYFKKLKMDAG